MELKIERITKYYGKTAGIIDLSAKLLSNNIYALVGHNGSGKSTTLNILAGILEQDRGTVSIDGKEINKKNVGFLPENNPLDGEFYVREAIKLYAAFYEKRKNRIDKNWQETLIEKVGLEKVLNKKLRELSKGYRQRMGIVMALLHNPDVLLLDEPFNGLDPEQLKEFISFMKELKKGKIILISTHLINEVKVMADDFLYFKENRLVDQIG